MLVTVRYLQLTTGDRLGPAIRRPDPAVARLLLPSARLVRRLYTAVGEDSSWVSRSAWTDARWTAELARPETEWWVLWSRDRIGGFFELWGGEPPHRSTSYIKYLGLLPEFRRRGLGGHLVARATDRALTMHRRWPGLPEVHRVTVDTCDADAPRALLLYEKQGFDLVREGEDDRVVTSRVAERIRRRCAEVST